jgi:hypothetical protein
MQHRFFLGIGTPKYYKEKTGADFATRLVTLCREKPIPDRLLLSRACFRFGFQAQNSIIKTIFTTCQKTHPFTVATILKGLFLF